MKMFHVERFVKTLFVRGFLVFIMVAFISTGCIRPRHTVEIENYIVLDNGRQVLGNDKGLSAFMFENNPRKIVFAQFIANKYEITNKVNMNYFVTVDGYRFKVFLYDTAEIEKYWDVGQFMVTKQETEPNILGSAEKFIALSVINDANEDCLAQGSLFRNVAITYLKNLEDEYNNL